ncbi:sensor histidine kinase [Thiomicrospira microaerophila]|uniref:sensor histidine kinase n=1 Tax=Thiomicrospira microaerophila TaxID=406020 RepID=UPI0005C96221|nr:ATP-binding protein [Thiomicrospira microaerophila]
MTARFTIRRRLLLLFLLLGILPLLAYRLAIDLQHLILNHQASLHQHTVQNLSLILETRPEIWGKTQEAGQILSHIDLEQSSIWLVNQTGQTQYVMGHLNASLSFKRDFLEWLGFSGIQLLGKVANPLPYPFPQSPYPEREIIEAALKGQTSQQYRINHQQNPISLMSATPLYHNNQIIGAVVFEQSIAQLFQQSLSAFHRLIGLSTLILLSVLTGVLFYAQAMSNRILRLGEDVKKSFSSAKKLQPGYLKRPERQNDELTQLRQDIWEMFEKLASYERYLKQLPKTLRHELHNPINRVSANLELLALTYPEQDRIKQAQQGLAQLQRLLTALSEASSLEQSLENQMLYPLAVQRISDYFQSICDSLPTGLVTIRIAQNLQDCAVQADGFLLEQLIDKLIDNALDFNNGRQPILLSMEKQSGQLVVRVSNAGPTIPDELKSQIFEGMVSLRATGDLDHAHLGLGLYLAKLIAQHHQAELSVDNWPDQQGVTFCLVIPLLDTPA